MDHAQTVQKSEKEFKGTKMSKIIFLSHTVII